MQIDINKQPDISAQLALPFRNGRQTCTIYLDLTKDAVERLVSAVNSIETIDEYGKIYLCSDVTPTLRKLLDAIIDEAGKEVP